MNEKETIKKPFLIICEGADEKFFFIWYLAYAIEKIHPRFEDIQVLSFNGINNLSSFIGILKNTEGFESVTNILIIRDAEKDEATAISQVNASLQFLGAFPKMRPGKWERVGNIKAAFLLLPELNDNPKPGTIEDLCINMLSEDNNEIIDGIQSFLNNVKTNYKRELRHEFKSKLHTYFSITDKYIGMKIGEAAKAGAFDWTNNTMKSFEKLVVEGLDLNNN